MSLVFAKPRALDILSTMKYSIKAAAKINLHLEIGGKRSDGFHGIYSLFHLIDLYDKVSIELHRRDNGIELNGPFDFPKEENLIYRAALAYRRTMLAGSAGISPGGLRIFCEKGIPSGGGLGGGSSDAAAVLKLLNLLYGHALSAESLAAVAAELGSDVPFFLGSAAAIARGRGEQLQAIEPLPDCHLLLLFPEWRVSTPGAYGLLDKAREGQNVLPRLEGQIERHGTDWEAKMRQGLFCNDFTPVLSRSYPVIEEYLGVLRKAGSWYANMSGSGSTLFGLFDTIDQLETAEKELHGRSCRCRRGKMLARPYEPVYNEHNI